MRALWLLIMLAVTAGSVAAAAPTVVVDGKLLQTAQPALNRGGTILLPMREVFEALGAEVRWLAAARKIEATRGDRRIELWLNTPVAQVNGSPVQLRTPPALVEGVTYVPLRFPAETFGSTVRWDPYTQTAFVYSPRT